VDPRGGVDIVVASIRGTTVSVGAGKQWCKQGWEKQGESKSDPRLACRRFCEGKEKHCCQPEISGAFGATCIFLSEAGGTSGAKPWFKKPAETEKLGLSDPVGFQKNRPNSVRFGKNRLKSI
jgi:hypothetical protein